MSFVKFKLPTFSFCQYFRSDVEDGEILHSKDAAEKRPRLTSAGSHSNDAPVRSNGFGTDARKSRSKSDSDASDDPSSKKRHKKSKKRRSESGSKRHGQYSDDDALSPPSGGVTSKRRSGSSEKRRDRYPSGDDLLNSPRAMLPASRFKRRNELARYDVRNVILKKREGKSKKKRSASRSR